jgi:serine/threonine-protein kinase
MTSLPPESESPVRVLGRYVLYREIASGGMATVHVGRLIGPAGFSRTVAIKRLHPQYARDPEFVTMFLDEARLAARIRHPNVVSTLDVVALEGELFLVMEFVQGESLSRLLRTSSQRDERVPVAVASAIATHTLLGLHAAHEAKSERGVPLGIVHRDVSPQNVLVGADGIARVVDFGVAKAASRLATTEEGRMKGKLAYMAPEQLRNLDVDRRTDVFALGIVLWEMLTGQRLFQANDPAVSIARILTERVAAPSSINLDLPKSLDAIVLKALQQDPAQRFQTARAMAEELERAITPAGAMEVGGWVERVAGAVLEDRGRRVAEVESISSIDSKLSGMVRASLADNMLGESISGLSDMSVAHSTRAPVKRSKLPLVLALLLLGALTAAAVVFFAASPGAELETKPAQSSVPTKTVEPVAAPPEQPPEKPEPVVSSTPPVPASSEEVASAPAALPKPKARPATTKATRSTKPNCDPPYVLNPDGSKRFKPDCF